MKKGIYFVLLLISISYASANMVCGYVNDSSEFSASWTNINVYYSEKPASITSCTVNPQNKFCCDLEAISSVKFSPGKTVYAEAFNIETGVIGGPVSLITTSEGFDVFPNMYLEEAIKNLMPQNRIFFNGAVDFHLVLAESLQGLNVTIQGENSSLEESICSNCSAANFSLNLFAGKNEIKFSSTYGRKDISKNLTLYKLDYLNISKTYTCNKCRDNFLPSNTLVNVTITVNSSHAIPSEISEYIPVQWETNESYSAYSDTHNLLKFSINQSKQNISYQIKTPQVFFPRIFEVRTELEGLQFNNTAIVFRFFKFFKWGMGNEIEEMDSAYYLVSPENPLVLHDDQGPVEMVAVFLKNQSYVVQAELKVTKNKGEIKYNIMSPLNTRNIEKILVRMNKTYEGNYTLISKGKEAKLKKNSEGYLEAYVYNFNFEVKEKATMLNNKKSLFRWIFVRKT